MGGEQESSPVHVTPQHLLVDVRHLQMEIELLPA